MTDNALDFNSAFSQLLNQFPAPPSSKPKLGLAVQWNNRVSKLVEDDQTGSLTKLHTSNSSDELSSLMSSGSLLGSPRSSLNVSVDRPSRPSSVGTSFDEKCFELLVKAMKGNALSQKEQQDLFWMLQEFNKYEVIAALERANKIIVEQALGATPKSKFEKVISSVRGEEVPLVKISKCYVDFWEGSKLSALNKEISCDVSISNVGNTSAKFKFIHGMPTKRYEFTFTPKEGVLKKKMTQNIKIGLTLRTTTKVNHVLTIEIEGGHRHYIVIRAESEKSVFGVDVNELPMTTDPTLGVTVPTVLTVMRNYLYDNGALTKQGIFRLTGDEAELVVIKDQLNRGTFTGCKDIHNVANLLKVWFRELPQPILSVLPQASLHLCDEQSECLAVYNAMPDPQKSVMKWILEILADTAAAENQNKTTARNLAVMFSPNLYSSSPDVDPVESLVLSSKAVNLVHQLILYRVKEKYNLTIS